MEHLRYLREFIREAVGASAGYMSKERRRMLIQQLIIQEIKSGNINSQEDLEVFLADINLSLTALKMIPFSVWQQM